MTTKLTSSPSKPKYNSQYKAKLISKEGLMLAFIAGLGLFFAPGRGLADNNGLNTVASATSSQATNTTTTLISLASEALTPSNPSAIQTAVGTGNSNAASVSLSSTINTQTGSITAPAASNSVTLADLVPTSQQSMVNTQKPNYKKLALNTPQEVAFNLPSFTKPVQVIQSISAPLLSVWGPVLQSSPYAYTGFSKPVTKTLYSLAFILSALGLLLITGLPVSLKRPKLDNPPLSRQSSFVH